MLSVGGGASLDDLLAARAQMALSLGFHIVFAEIGIAMPLLMVLAEWRWRRSGDPVFGEQGTPTRPPSR